MAEARASILIQARDQATQTIGNVYNVTINNNQRLAQSQTTAAAAADKHKFSIVDLAAKLYLVQVGFRNVINVLREGFELAELGAQVQQQSLALKNLVEGAGGDYLNFLKQLRAATDGTIADFELQAIASKALIGTSGELRQEMLAALPKILEISKAYGDLHPEVGGTERAFESLVTGIRRSSIRLIDNAGIVVQLGTLYEDYAQKIGKSTDELTAEEQQLAIVYGIQKEGLVIMDQAGQEISILTDRYEKLRAGASNLRSDLGELANAGFAPIIDKLNESFTQIHDFTIALKELAEISPQTAEALSLIDGVVLGIANGLSMGMLPMLELLAKLMGVATEEISRYVDAQRGAEGRQAAFTHEVENSIPVVDEFAELLADEKFADNWAKTVDKLLDKQADLNREWIDAMQDWEAESIDIANDLNDKLADIQAEAIEDRADAWKDFTDRVADLQYDLVRRMRDLQHDLTMSLRNEDESYDDRRREIERRKYEMVRDFGQKEEELMRDVAEAKTAEERAQAEERLRIARRELEDKLDDMQYDLSELKRKHEREKSQIQERFQWERDTFAEHNAHQQQELQNALNEKIASINAAEIEATARANEESEKRRAKALADLEATKKEIDEKFKMAWIDALLAVVPEGSKLHTMLTEAKLLTSGATQETINYRNELLELGRTAEGLRSVFASIGVSNISQLQTAIRIAQLYPAQNIAFPGRAHGGGVSAGQPYMVGESGPELFVPSGGGNIVPNVGGGNVSVTLQMSGPFMGSEADAIRYGNQIGPVVLKWMQRHGVSLPGPNARRNETVLSNV